MFTVYLTNFGYSLEGRFADLEAALVAVRKTCFEAMIFDGPRHVASWSPIGGTRYVDRPTATPAWVGR